MVELLIIPKRVFLEQWAFVTMSVCLMEYQDVRGMGPQPNQTFLFFIFGVSE